MITRSDIIEEAHRLGFGDVGFTSAEPFTSHRDYLQSHQDEFGWAEQMGLALMSGTDPKAVLSSAKSVIVLLDIYFREAFPASLEAHFGRVYLDDDRYVNDLIRAYNETGDERVKGMIAWALGRIGGKKAKDSLKSFSTMTKGIIHEEIEAALEQC
jgi:epoxyqueuosine reductase QueG